MHFLVEALAGKTDVAFSKASGRVRPSANDPGKTVVMQTSDIASLKHNTTVSHSNFSGSGKPNDPFRGATYLPAGPIFNDGQARTKCPEVCQSFGGWSQDPWGAWFTTIPGRMSVCRCDIDSGLQTIMAPGTIWE